MVSANLPWVESPFFHEIIKTKNLPDDQLAFINDYQQNGFVVVSGALPQALIDRVREDAETKAFNPDFPLTTQRDATRVQDFWKASGACKELACHPYVLEKLQLLYDRVPVPFQTLNFKVGTQQRAHSDTIPLQFVACTVHVRCMGSLRGYNRREWPRLLPGVAPVAGVSFWSN